MSVLQSCTGETEDYTTIEIADGKRRMSLLQSCTGETEDEPTLDVADGKRRMSELEKFWALAKKEKQRIRGGLIAKQARSSRANHLARSSLHVEHSAHLLLEQILQV